MASLTPFPVLRMPLLLLTLTEILLFPMVLVHYPKIFPFKNTCTKDMEKEEPFCTVGGNVDWCSHCGKQCEIPQKIKNETAVWPRDPTSGNISEGIQNTNSKERKHPYVHCSVIHNCQDMEAAQVPINREWIKQLWGIYTMEYYSAIKKKENFTLCNSMDGPGEHYSKWNKPVRGR